MVRAMCCDGCKASRTVSEYRGYLIGGIKHHAEFDYEVRPCPRCVEIVEQKEGQSDEKDA
jgi:hypothetical protein